MQRFFVIGVASFLMLLVGCAGGRFHETDVEKGVYAPEDLDRFEKDTATLPYRVLEPEYVIGVGDQLDVIFLYHSNLSTRELTVRRDGKISLPYVGDQVAAGLEPMMLDSLLTIQFAEILRQPNISVIVRAQAPQRVYVLGQVGSPGQYKFDGELSLIQALAASGGVKREGDAEHAVLIRREGMERIVGVEVDVAGILEGGNLSQDLRLRNYDIVYVPKRPIYSAAEFVQLVSEILLGPLDVVYRGWQIATLSANYEFFRRTVPSDGQ